MGQLDEGSFEACLGLDGEVEEEEVVELTRPVGAESIRLIEEAVRVLIEGLGEDPERDGLKKTPHRVAKAFVDATKGYAQNVNDIVQGALFPEAGLENGLGQAGGAGGLVVVRDINLFSYCVSCLLPFRIRCHVGYVPSRKRVLGLSKLARVAEVFAKRLQDPLTLADEVCSALHKSIRPAGVAVALQCWHVGLPQSPNCNSHPKCQSETEGWLQVSVCSRSGVFKNEKSSSWNDFLALLKLKGINMEACSKNISLIESWCQLRSIEVPLSNGHNSMNSPNWQLSSKNEASHSRMITAVASILHSLGEDPSRKELAGTPYRFVQWMMNFRKPVLEAKLKLSDSLSNGIHQNTTGECLQELNLPFCSQCEHHLLPFHGVAHIGYYAKEGSNGIERSALQALVSARATRLQVQERLTRQIAEAVYRVSCVGVIVVVEANHICMVSRGIEKIGSSTATIAIMGRFSNDPAAKADFLHTVAKRNNSIG